ncbi:MAG TPA: alanine/glycine:cation symporter family protein [Bacteroidales bacterium]
MILRRALPILFFIIIFQTAFSQDSIRTSTSDKPFESQKVKKEMTVSEKIDAAFKPVVDGLGNLLFWDPFAAMGLHDPLIYDEMGNPVMDKNGKPLKSSVPLVVVWLILGALTFTIFFKFVNIRGFWHAIQLTRGIYDNPKEPGEVSHFQALTTALSATVGLGNIAGVAVAISIGGPGATFWMIVAGLLGMSSKFTECTLGVKYRQIDENGVVSGGPMYYLRDGLKKKGMKWLGLVLSGLFALLVIGGSFGGGNMFQANQSFSQLTYIVPGVQDYGAWYGVILAILVGIVIIGGIKSIARITDKIVPIMALLYVGTSIFIILTNITHTLDAFRLIYDGAFGSDALKGGLVGVLIVGFQRAAFSNEAGVGSAAIAHSAVKTDKPISEGFVSLLEPFVDTVVICTMTALVLIFTGTYENPLGLEGSQLTSEAYGQIISWFPYVLLVAIFLFAFSTMISWSYYGLNGFNYLFGGIFEKVFKNKNASKYTYFVIFLMFIVIGASSSLGSVIDFSDMMILAMAFPNILGLLILAPEVKQEMNEYFDDLKKGDIKRYK